VRRPGLKGQAGTHY